MTALFDPLLTGTLTIDALAGGITSPAGIIQRQQFRLNRLLSAALAGSPFYRKHLGNVVVGGTPLRALASVSRGELMSRFDDWVTDPKLKLAEVHKFTADTRRIGEAYLGKYMIWESSGTSRQPGVFIQDAHAMAVYDALEAVRRSTPRLLHRCFDPMFQTERVAFVGAIGGHFASVGSIQRLRRINPWMKTSVRCFSILQRASVLMNELNAFAPTVIVTYPTAAVLLAENAARGLLRVSPKEVWTGGEKLSVSARSLIGHAMGCAVRDSYGASEFLSIGWECVRGRMHANTDWVILEPIDERGHPVPPGQRSHSTLLTNLANHVQPLIRYELGDQLTMFSERCECGSSLPVIEVEGRSDDVLVMAGSKGQAVTLLPLALITILEDEAGVFDFQLRQRDGHTLTLTLDRDDPDVASAVVRCRAALTRFAISQAVARFRLVVELGKPAAVARSGKGCRIVSAKH
jgi:phenylacetate-CoA ligase